MSHQPYPTNNFLKAAKQFHNYEDVKLAFRKKDGTYIDLTGLVITMEFRKDSPDGVSVLKLTLSDKLSIITEDTITKLLISSFSINEPGDIFYDIRMTNTTPPQKVKYYISGAVKIYPSVTKQDN